MLGIIQWIGPVLLWTGRPEDSDNWRTHGRSQMHWTAIVSNKESASLNLRRALSKARLPRYIYDRPVRNIELGY